MTHHDCPGCRALEDLIEAVWNRVMTSDFPGHAVAMGAISFLLSSAMRDREEAHRDAVIAASARTAHTLLEMVLINPAMSSRLFEEGRWSGGNAVAMLEMLCFVLGHQSPQVQRLMQEIEAALKPETATMQ